MKKNETELEKISHPTAKDFGVALAKIALAPASELIDLVITTPMSKRKDAFISDLAVRVKNMESKATGFTIESLKDNELFQTIIINAIRAAIATHQQEKIQALKNAVLNAALKPNINENVQMMFINYIDRLTPLHLIILKFLQYPKEYCEKHKIEIKGTGSSVFSVLNMAIKDVEGHVIEQIVKDLFTYGFINVDIQNYKMTVTIQAVLNSHTTPFGNQFLTYITEPE